MLLAGAAVGFQLTAEKAIVELSHYGLERRGEMARLQQSPWNSIQISADEEVRWDGMGWVSERGRAIVSQAIQSHIGWNAAAPTHFGKKRKLDSDD
jgi:hypothetical protein